MPIIMNNYDWIFLKESIEENYPNGLSQFKIDYEHGSSQADSEDDFLLSFGFQNYEIFKSKWLKENENYFIGSKWKIDGTPNNLSPKWIKQNGLYYWYFKSNTQSRLLEEDVTMDEILFFVKKFGSLPSSFN